MFEETMRDSQILDYTVCGLYMKVQNDYCVGQEVKVKSSAIPWRKVNYRKINNKDNNNTLEDAKVIAIHRHFIRLMTNTGGVFTIRNVDIKDYIIRREGI